MASRQILSWLILVVGVVLAFISIFADRIGLGGTPGFGWKQTLGLLIGVALIVLGVAEKLVAEILEAASE